MKKLLEKISLLKIITVIVIVALVASFVSTLPEYVLKSTPVQEVLQVGIPENGEVISKAIDGSVKVASNNGKTLYVEPKTLNVTVVDDVTGMTWTSMPTEGNTTEAEKAPMNISFLDATGAVSNWDVFTYCIKNDNTTRELEEGESLTDTYTITKIENGFRATLKVSELESAVLNEYMPKQISVERYNECFINKIDTMLAEGKIDEDQATKYNKALSMIYALDEENQDYYYNKYAGTPPVTVSTILIDLAKKVQYTTEDLINDSREFNIMDVQLSHPADFTIVMDVTLDDGDLVVHVPTYEIENNSEDKDYYTLHSITVFPNFGVVDATKYNEGFIFVPDGSGALFDINSYDSGYVEYERAIYDNTYYDTLYSDTEYNEDVMMPVFGMGKKGAYFIAAEEAVEGEEVVEEATEVETVVDDNAPVAIKTEKKDADYNGFMAIIESGAETASIAVKLGTTETSGSANFNKVYATFDVMQYSNVKVFGPYSTNDAKFLATTSSFDIDIKVRYELYSENCNYYTMAQTYRDYLINKYGATESYAAAPEIFLDVISSLTVEDRFMGVPYDRTISMTTYSELAEILGDLEGVDTVVSYKGAYNGGIYNTINTKADKTSANGSEKEYESLMLNYGDSIYMSTPISYVYEDSAIFKASKHGLLGYDSEAVEIYNYDIPTGRFNIHGESHWVLSPYYLPEVVKSFSKSAGNTNLAIEDLGNIVYGNYKPAAEVNLFEGEAVINNALATLTENDRSIILYNPIATRMLYADYSADISRESSDYGLIAHNVPFRQLVMNGLTKYTTLDINESSSGKAYYLLQALELGSSPKYKITYKSVDRLKENNYSELYSTEYKLIAEDIKAMNKTISDEFGVIGTTQITGHEIVEEKVFATTYATGVKVITNYNTFAIDTEYGTVDGFGYILVAADGTVIEDAEPAAENAADEAEVVEDLTEVETIVEGGEVNE